MGASSWIVQACANAVRKRIRPPAAGRLELALCAGDLFAVVLQYLRTRQRPAEAILAKHGAALLDECEYFGLDALAQKIRGETCPLDLRPDDRRLREKEFAARSGGDLARDMLIDVHAVENSPLHREGLELPLLMTSEPPPLAQGSFEDFRRRLDAFSGDLLSDLADIGGLVIGGGAVIGALTQCPAGDIDIFINAPAEEAMVKMEKIFGALQQNQKRYAQKRRLMVTRSKNAVSFYRVSGKSVALPPVQVDTATPAHLL